MAFCACTRVILILAWIKLVTAQYTIPNVNIEPLQPKGIRVSIPDSPGVSLFVFHGNIKRPKGASDSSLSIVGEITAPINGRWTFEDRTVQLNVGDVIHYYVQVVHNQMRYATEPDSIFFLGAVPASPSPVRTDEGRGAQGQWDSPGTQPFTFAPLTDNTNTFAVLASPSPVRTDDGRGSQGQWGSPGTKPFTFAPLPDNTHTSVVEVTSTTNPTTSDCGVTLTRVKDGQACAGKIIFEDRFDLLREDVWQIEQYIPDEPDFPFISYQRPFNARTVSVQGGNLRIEPKLQQNIPGFGNSSIETGILDLLSGCTSISTKCRAEAWGASILPPIVSGRLTLKSFAFTYGVVEIRAKLPQGDWLYPDILLESSFKKYGSLNYASGVVRVGGARGNVQLAVGSVDFGNKLLYGGVLMDATCRDTLLRNKTSSQPWGDDFHIYSVRWTPDAITLSVDGEEWARFAASDGGLKNQFSASCDVPRSALASGSKLAPFDDHFVITLGLAAGGVTEFPDDSTSGEKPKPWRNTSRKASLHFWQDMASWIETWRQPALLVDYVTVRAL